MKPLSAPAAFFASLLTLGLSVSPGFGQETAFSYQGKLNANTAPANGSFDLTFALFTASNGVGQVGSTLTNLNTGVTNGLFAVTLDFGPGIFNGASLWLEMGVRTNGGTTFTTLAPLQPLMPVPYAIFAGTASNLLGALPAAQLSGTLPLTQLPGGVLTNNQTGVTFNGALTTTNVSAGTGGNLWVQGSSGSSVGGSITIASGNAGIPTGGAGGNLNLQAGNAMAAGGSGYSGLGPAGSVNITAGSGYNSVGGNVTIQSGGNTPWDLTPNLFSKVSLLGGIMNPGDNAQIDVESGHNTTYGSPPQNSAGGNVKIIGGSSTTGFSGGNILLLPGSGSPNGFVGIGKTNPATMLDVNGTVTASGFVGSGTGLTGLNASQLTGTLSLAQLPANVVTNNGTAPIEQVVTNFAIPGYIASLAVNPALNKIYLSGGASAAQQIIVVDGNTFGQTAVGAGMGVDVDVTNNNYWSGGVYADNVTIWSSSNTALGSEPTGAGCSFEASLDAPHRRAWVGAQCSDSIWVFNADTFGLVSGPISPGGTMGQLLANPASGRAYFNANGVSKRVNPSTFAVTANAFGSVVGVNAQANRLYAQTSGKVLQIIDGSPDPEVVLTNVTLPFAFSGPVGVNPVLNEVYVQQSTNSVLTVDGTTGATLGSVVLGTGVTSVGNITVDASHGRVYVLAYAGSTPFLYVLQVSLPPALTLNGTIAASAFSGNGAGLTALNYNSITNPPAIPTTANLVATNDTRAVGLANPANQFAGSFTGPVTGTNINASGPNLWMLGSSGTSTGGNITVAGGNAAVATGGSGGNLNLRAGNAMAAGGSGWGGLGPAGAVNVTAGNGYNSVGGNVVIQSGGNSPWTSTANLFSKVSLQGIGFLTGDGATIDVEGGHNISSSGASASSGGNVRIVGGNATGSYAGGNIVLLPGSGTPGGNVGVGTSSPGYPLTMASGAYCSAAGVWTSVSDRNVKEDFTNISPAVVLEKVVALPITQWKYKAEPNGVKHMGPVAQDFHAAFGLGDSDKAIGSVDEDGVALAAIQGLNQKLEEQKIENAQLKARLEKLEQLLNARTAEAK